MPMNPEIKAKWLAALRSGIYKQGTGALRPSPTTFCCLGVLCEVLEVPQYSVGYQPVGEALYTTTLPGSVVRQANLPSNNPTVRFLGEQSSLVCMNDGGHTFEQIATAIEQTL